MCFCKQNEETKETKEKIKCLAIGDVGIGKTCLLVSYTTNAFPGEYIPTTFDNYSSDVMIDDKQIELILSDFDPMIQPTQSERMRPSPYIQDIFLICFSIDSKSSYQNVTEKWLPQIKHHVQDPIFLLIGTKMDLRNSNDKQILENLISRSDGEKLAKELGATLYMECSAKTQNGLKNVFDETVRVVLNKRALNNKRSKNCQIM